MVLKQKIIQSPTMILRYTGAGLQANWRTVRMILPAWFDYLKETFLTQMFSSKRFACLRKAVALLLKMFMKPLIHRSKLARTDQSLLTDHWQSAITSKLTNQFQQTRLIIDWQTKVFVHFIQIWFLLRLEQILWSSKVIFRITFTWMIVIKFT